MDVFEACRTGNLAWLKQQKATGTSKELILQGVKDGEELPLKYAVRAGHLNVVKWIVGQYARNEEVCAASGQYVTIEEVLIFGYGGAAAHAVASGQLGILKWLISRYGLKKIGFEVFWAFKYYWHGREFRSFCWTTVQWLLDEYRKINKSELAFRLAVQGAAWSARLELLTQLVEEWSGGGDIRNFELLVNSLAPGEKECRAYLLSVRSLQDLIGMEAWRELVSNKAVQSEQKPKRRI